MLIIEERMNKYIIEWKIRTLAIAGYKTEQRNTENPTKFSIDELEFSQWSFTFKEGQSGYAWICHTTAEANNYNDALQIIGGKLDKIVSRLSLITQCYIEFYTQPFLIIKDNAGFLSYRKQIPPVELHCGEKEQEALSLLLSNNVISDEFYYYWNEASNNKNYSAKLLLMFSALEALVKKQSKHAKLKEILGEELHKELFEKKDKVEKKDKGLRHRLVHGDYFSARDSETNYVEEVHKKVIKYFNSEIFNQKLIEESVISPQRNFDTNINEHHFWIKNKNQETLNLRSVLQDFDKNTWDKLSFHEISKAPLFD